MLRKREGEPAGEQLLTLRLGYFHRRSGLPLDTEVQIVIKCENKLDHRLSRSENDIEASRRIKTEFLVQMDGVGAETEPSDNTNRTDEAIEHRKSHILVIGATNRYYLSPSVPRYTQSSECSLFVHLWKDFFCIEEPLSFWKRSLSRNGVLRELYVFSL